MAASSDDLTRANATMSHTVYTFNRFHLGDNLVFLHLLRALAKQRVSTPFVHFCHGQDIGQLREAVVDLPNIILEPFESALWQEHEREAVDTWKNSGRAWESSPLRWDWSAFTLWHHGAVARSMGMESPFTCREHLLFDYPRLDDNSVHGDFLIVNSEPNSGQFGPMAKHGSGYLNELTRALIARGKIVAMTIPVEGSIRFLASCTVSEMGRQSTGYRHHIMIATGPMWPTLNTANHHHHEGRKRIVLLDNGEQLNMPHITQCATVEEVMKIAQEAGWI